MHHLFLCGLCILMMATAQAKNKILRVAAYGGEIPISLIKKFEAKTGIKVNFTNFESNENLLIKLESSHQKLYDVITPISILFLCPRHKPPCLESLLYGGQPLFFIMIAIFKNPLFIGLIFGIRILKINYYYSMTPEKFFLWPCLALD